MKSFKQLAHKPVRQSAIKSCSNIQRNETYFEILSKKLKTVKQPTLPLKPVIWVNQWAKPLRFQKLQKNIEKTLQTDNNLNFLRQVRGDGNCFLRAMAFEYLSKLHSTKINRCFIHLENMILTCSDTEKVPQKFLPFYNHQFLSYCLKQNWQQTLQKYLDQNQNNFRLALASMLADNPYLDFILMLYMRGLTLMGLKKYKSDPFLRNFLQKKDEEKLRNYGNLSDGLTHFITAKMLSVDLHIYQIRSSQILKYSYFESQGRNLEINLLFHNHHYDLLQSQADVNLESSSPTLKRKHSYYSDKNSQTFYGQCSECQQIQPVYVDNNLCEQCYQQHAKAFKSFKELRSQVNEKVTARSSKSINRSSLQKDNPQFESVKSRSSQMLKSQKEFKKQEKSKKRRIFGCFG